MRYEYPILLAMSPKAAQIAAQVGKFSVNRMLVEVPDSTVFEGEMPKPVSRGFGDDIARIAQPIANALTKMGMNIGNCGGCKNRQAKLNEAFPNPIDKPIENHEKSP